MIKQMEVNTKVSYEALHGLIGRANNNEKLMVADQWLRGNETITIEQFHQLRDLWNKMGHKYGTFSIIISAGTVKHTYATGLAYKEAYRVCKDSHWQHNHNNGLMWDMEIEEEY